MSIWQEATIADKCFSFMASAMMEHVFGATLPDERI